MFNKGDILVVKKGVPARFRNLKPGTLWKCVESDGFYGGAITVGDQNHPSIRTNTQHFLLLDSFTKDQIRNTVGYEGNGTDLSVRLEAIEQFKPEVKTRKTQHVGHVRVKVNGVRTYIPNAVAAALAAKNSQKLVQRKLIEKLGGV